MDTDIPRNWAPAFSDVDLARRFISRHRPVVRYVATRKKWMIWNGKRWATDEREYVHELIRQVCCDAAAELVRSKSSTQARSICSSRTIAAVERIAARNSAIAATVDKFDQEMLYLNTPDGIVDLRDGSIYKAEPWWHLSRMTKVGPADPKESSSRWQKALDEWTDGDTMLQGYLQRIAGYCLSGSTKERAVFVLHGPRNDGARIYLETLVHLLGTYAITMPMETFLWSTYARHPTEIAALQGRRLVAAIEAEIDKKWDTSRLLALTNGNRVTARVMHGDFFEYEPTAKLMFLAISLPSIDNATEEVRQLFHMIPFPGSVPRDPTIHPNDLLYSERSAILRWAVDGHEWYKTIGLAAPSAAIQATRDYVQIADPVNAWLADHCIRDPAAITPMRALWHSWSCWCREGREEQIISQQRFAKHLMQRGFTRYRKNSGVVYRGLRLREI